MKTKEYGLLRMVSMIAGAAVVFAVVFLGVSVDTQAAGEDTVEFVPVQEGYYAVSGTASKDIDTSYNLGVAKIGAAYKEAGGLAYLDVKFMKKNGVYVMVLSANDVNTLKNMHTTTMNWLAQNAPSIVPSGTKRSDAILKAADWVADRMTYDYTAVNNPQLLASYQNAMSCYKDGKGVCTTYATAFDAMIAYLPINPKTGCVDYTCTSAVYIDAMLVANADHAWSAVAETDGWHMYDITFYDNNNLSKCPQYLDMDTATMNDGFHSNITTLLAGYSENTYASK
ncbi:MAG: hypothetical protein J6N47_04700 [Lachnospiraceae bacterium]|nr:hypothetical protein [Lachnospiraceae bacterium]